ncbi:BZ3500_MvSof-1268-A1-R1_Chr11-1g03167 [Microbotryum saponariae]|uniref:BZ3500_MvSof-1268-A1-R1_Chr11-1g03167 protein n=1 Tax=Microbotryum saponariae TaxID=289078 RepID=A0A2X0NF26_9BASI|nr:BZ3501_MvSof-1269-A2-R1_Chr11g02742 [Microbotryum saponariae]SDA03727.1 BZ3500_MvSof-1268-A1-R1_Chr11-1g03167 [Microbotryum saponariae]
MGEKDIECGLKKGERENETKALDSIRLQAVYQAESESINVRVCSLKGRESCCD